jgi:hypothetical protein
MKKIVIAASLMFVATAQAQTQSEQMMDLAVEMTPLVAEKAVASKVDSRFADYALENSSSN